MNALGLTVRVSFVIKECSAHAPSMAARIEKLASEMRPIRGRKEVRVTRTHTLAGKLNFAQTAVVCRIGRIAVRTLRDLLMKGVGDPDPRSRWAIRCRIRLIPDTAPRKKLAR